MNFVTILMKVLKNPRSLLGMGMIIIIFLVYILGPKIGLTGWKRLAAVAVLLVLFLVLQMILASRSARKKKKAAEDLETSLIIEADQNVAAASDSEKAARENARRELQAAIQVLKESRLADGRGGKAALYVLPWFMVLGTEESGKGDIIRNSGLQRPDQGPGDLVGIGSSPSCEWWFTNQAVIMEADRRFADLVEEKGVQKKWEAFLDLLGKHHSRTPLNGVVITVSATELLQGRKEDIRERARLLRRRLDAMRENLSQIFPVYVMVTKLDLLLGFDDFFTGISPEGAAQVFGATLRQAGGGGWSRRAFDQEFDLLGRTLRKRRLMRLVREDNPARKDGTYLFPLEFQGLREPLAGFLDTLCEENAYGANPLLRGFYFAAAGGGGQIADVVLAEISQVIGVSRVSGREAAAPTGKAYFLRDFFRKVLLPDRSIARPTRGAAQRARVLRRTLQFAALGVLLLAGVLLSVSFGRNMALVGKTKILAAAASNVHPADNDLKSIDQALRELDALREHLVRLDQLEHHRPLTLGLGMYQGGKVREPALEVYLNRLRDILVVPSREELFLWLNGNYPDVKDLEASSLFSRRYRVYRSLFTPHPEDADLMAGELVDLWSRMESPVRTSGDPLARIEDHIRFAMGHADVFGRFCGNEQVDRDLKWRGNKFVRETWRAETFYRQLVADIDNRVPPFRVDPMRYSGLVSVGPDGEPVSVPGSFTKAGWTGQVRDRILNSDTELRNDWLLKEVFEERASGIGNRLLGYYERDYKKKWNEFLAAVDMPREADLGIMAGHLDKLLDEDSSFLRLLDDAAENLRFKEKESKVGPDVVETMKQIEEAFGALHSFVRNKAPRDGSPPQDDFRAGVRGILDKLWELNGADDFSATLDFSRSVFDDPGKPNPISVLRDFAYKHSNPIRLGGAESNHALQIYLSRPARAAWRTCLEVTTRYLDQQWEQEVWNRFAETLNAKYPCSATTTDATVVDFSDFFGPEGALSLFLDRKLKSFLAEDGSLKQVYGESLGLGAGTITALGKARQFRDTMFQAGKLHVTCTLTARQLVTVSGVAPDFGASLVKVGNKNLIYRWGAAEKKTFVWPDEAGEVPARVAVLCLEAGCDKPAENKVAKSEWALFRLLDQAELPPLSQREDSFNIRWLQSYKDRYTIAVPYRLKAESRHHPFRKDFLRFDCPRSLRD